MSLTFGKALEKMRDGAIFQRADWGVHNYVRVFEGEALLIHAVGGWGMWKPKQVDLLACDWVLWKPLHNPQGKLKFTENKPLITDGSHDTRSALDLLEGNLSDAPNNGVIVRSMVTGQIIVDEVMIEGITYFMNDVISTDIATAKLLIKNKQIEVATS